MKKEAAIWVAVIWFALTFFIGFLDSTVNQRPIDPNKTKSGCVYKSVVSYFSPGYMVACELFRNRFEREGFGPILEQKK